MTGKQFSPTDILEWHNMQSANGHSVQTMKNTQEMP